MHTSKPFPYRPTVVARQDKPLSGSGALAGNDPDMVRPDYDAPYRRAAGPRKPVRPAASDPQRAFVEPQVVHEPAAAPRPARTHPTLPPLYENNPFAWRRRAYCPVGMSLAGAALIAGCLLAFGIAPASRTASHIAVDDWCGQWPAALSCKQQNAGKQN